MVMHRLPRSVKRAQKRIACFMKIRRRYGKPALLVCAACGAPWQGYGSPADCPVCKKWSYAVSKG